MQLDLHERFGIDCGDRELMRARTWSWMRLHIRALLGTNSRLDYELRPDK